MPTNKKSLPRLFLFVGTDSPKKEERRRLIGWKSGRKETNLIGPKDVRKQMTPIGCQFLETRIYTDMQNGRMMLQTLSQSPSFSDM